jgi:hypothetical protein
MNPNHALIVGVGADLPMTVPDARGAVYRPRIRYSGVKALTMPWPI